MIKTFVVSQVILKHIQIKSIKKARKLAKVLNIIEIECGIQSVEFRLIDSFICPDINENKLGKTPMEKVLRRLIKAYRNG